MNPQGYEIHFAPLQGYTDWIYRNNFDCYFGGADAYYTPFVRLEAGHAFRNRDLRDVDPANNTVPLLIPQILPGNADEFRELTQLVASKGYQQIDINLGCSFPLIAGKKKGAGMLPYPELVKETLSPIEEFPDICFSVKMRLGWENAGEVCGLINIINSLRLEHVSVHARIGIQQYKGSPDYKSFSRFYEICKHPVFYNGDLKSIEEIHQIFEKYPKLRGVLVGRGLLSSPWMATDFCKNETKSDSERKKQVYAFHESLLNDYKNYLQGEAQLLNKMKTLWDYLLPNTDRKIIKKIRKTTRLSDYCQTVKQILD